MKPSFDTTSATSGRTAILANFLGSGHPLNAGGKRAPASMSLQASPVATQPCGKFTSCVSTAGHILKPILVQPVDADHDAEQQHDDRMGDRVVGPPDRDRDSMLLNPSIGSVAPRPPVRATAMRSRLIEDPIRLDV